jgi:outer membrane protein OmpA-like peptidoglycan-associated protein
MIDQVVSAGIDEKRRPVRRFVPAIVMLGLLTAGCSWFSGSSADQSSAPAAAPAPSNGQPGSFPNLASVPDQAPPSTPKIERDKLVQGLMADRTHAEYTDQSLGEETANVPAAAAPPPEPKATDQAAAPADGQAAGAAASTPSAPALPAPPQIAELPSNLGTATALIYFAAASTDLTDHDRAVLHDVAQAYSKERSSRLRVVGHASATEVASAGTAGANQFDTALARADTVAKALIGMGVPPRVLETSTGGATYDETQANGVAANRRVEVYIGQ